jgi:hypothetical protein
MREKPRKTGVMTVRMPQPLMDFLEIEASRRNMSRAETAAHLIDQGRIYVALQESVCAEREGRMVEIDAIKAKLAEMVR